MAGRGAQDRATLEVAHERVLDAWPRLADWIGRNAEAVRARRDLERAATEWDQAKRPGSAVRTGALLKRYRVAAEPRSKTANSYLTACSRRQWLQWAGTAVVVLAAAIALWVLVRINEGQYPQYLAARGLALQLGLVSVPEPEMASIPAGSFEMGDHHGVRESATPVHEVEIPPFAIGVHEVTFDEYDLFAAATGRSRPGDEGWGRGNRPVINVTWEDASAYAVWLTGKTGRAYRLPTEAEWEYAVRGGREGQPFFWGEEVSQVCQYGNVQDETFDLADTGWESNLREFDVWEPAPCADGFGAQTAPVGSFEENGFGLYDMAGNVWEWMRDCYEEGYDGAPVDGSARETEHEADCSARVVRGGSWGGGPNDARSAVRVRYVPFGSSYYLGFRLARSF